MVEMVERPDACAAGRGTVLIRLGHACCRQRRRCKGRGWPFTRIEPRGQPAELKRHAIALYCCRGLSMQALQASKASEMRCSTALQPRRLVRTPTEHFTDGVRIDS